jgi:hypothetical protein
MGWVLLLGVLIVVVVIFAWRMHADAAARKHDESARRWALDRVRRLAEEGTDARICAYCHGSGHIVVATGFKRRAVRQTCEHCRGLGFRYEAPIEPPIEAPIEPPPDNPPPVSEQ